MKLPIHRLKASTVKWLLTHYCKHGHNFIEHYSCYVPNEVPKVEFLDIETSNLDADFGIMLSYCIKEAGSEKIHEGVLTTKDILGAKAGDEDARLVKQCIEDMQKFDILVGYYSKRFDVPFIRTRAVACGLFFPAFGSIKHIDMYDKVKGKFKLSSRRLENACRVLLGKTQKTRIDAKYWRAAVRGEAKSLAYVLDHNRKDVIDLELLYDKIIDYSRWSDTSI